MDVAIRSYLFRTTATKTNTLRPTAASVLKSPRVPWQGCVPDVATGWHQPLHVHFVGTLVVVTSVSGRQRSAPFLAHDAPSISPRVPFVARLQNLKH
ncbi:hypothetical protein PLEOSDRAFT_1089251 [Pleurotus ostreatus PC15]|uniref:Uncharacterized protein n=1 Tax=Pleurotus ostreatus (strain PC15) TaxID=1137138 RepID=A0A067P1V8_PLEO1|nr:hypothetical protein PLEOSDRAFT_1089251 [Pleurotus ostreatus PC15]